MPKEHKKKKNKGKKRDREAHWTDLENQMEPNNPGQKIYLRLKIQTNPNKIGESSSNIKNGESLATTDPEVNSPSNNETIVTSDQQPKNFLRLKSSGPKDVFERNAKRRRYATRISEEQEEQSSNEEDEGSETTLTSNPNFTRIDPISRQDKRRAYQQSEESRAYQREHQRSYRQNRTNSIPEEINSWESTRRTYEKSIREGPTVLCICCSGLFFIKDVSLVGKEVMLQKWKCDAAVVQVAFWTIEYNVFDNYKNLTVTKAGSDKHYFCANSPRHTFQQLWTHNGVSGQHKSKGGIVKVPVNADTTVSSLTRNFNDTETVHVRLARKLCFEKDYMKGNVSPSKVWVAAEYLASTTLYQENLNQEPDNIDEEIYEAEEEDELDYDETFDD
ncbi:hypothetical protein INT47_005536 [Mucor saturninus]|uniref:Uncharacterized protein n=1 Tax=Mucor saturninus TaxID=64648 RepID=A0A8H7VCD2_9FUNG|nr:hypothetical protein INT47_005536 [Mucor saturninus]